MSLMTKEQNWISEEKLSRFEEAIPAQEFFTISRSIDPAILKKSPEIQREIDYLLDLFRMEVNYFLHVLGTKAKRKEWFKTSNRFRELRDQYSRSGYKGRGKLPSHYWRMALQRAYQTWANYWKAGIAKTRTRIQYGKKWTQLNKAEQQFVKRHLRGLSEEFFRILDRETCFPQGFPENLKADIRAPYKLCRMIRFTFRKIAGRFPKLGNTYSMWVDESCYAVPVDREEKGAVRNANGGFAYTPIAGALQQIRIATHKRGQRLAIAVSGLRDLPVKQAKGKCEPERPTLKIVRTPDGRYWIRVQQHFRVSRPLMIPVDLVPPEKDSIRFSTLDLGYTECFTDDQGSAFGSDLGVLLKQYADYLTRKDRERNRFYALMKTTQDPVKRRNIARFNLGKKRFYARRKAMQARIIDCMNAAINELFCRNPAQCYGIEAFGSKSFSMDGLGKKMRRKLSLWVRGQLKERLCFKAARRGVKVVLAPSAYSSQTCTECGYADRENRHGDSFKCLCCGHTAQSDTNAAQNLLMRAHDKNYESSRMTLQSVWTIIRETHRRLCNKLGLTEMKDPHLSRKH